MFRLGSYCSISHVGGHYVIHYLIHYHIIIGPMTTWALTKQTMYEMVVSDRLWNDNINNLMDVD